MNKKSITLVLLSAILILCSCSNKHNSSSSEFSYSSNESSSEHINVNNSSESSSEVVSSSEILNENISSEIISSEISSEISSNGQNTSSDNSSSSEIEVSLDIPTLTLDSNTGVVTWTQVEGATHYNYVINDGEVETTTNTTIALEDKQNVSVQASNDTTCSEFSKAVTYYDTSDVIIKEEKEVKVYFHDSNINSMTVTTGNTITRPNDPTKVNHTFDDWYSDSFFQEKFDFSKPIEGKTVIYANWIPSPLIDNTYFWLKASPKITSSIISTTSSTTGWRFIPLKVNQGQTSFKEFYVTIQVSGASSTDPAKFLVMDGFKDDNGRTYWKNNGSDFTINSDGTYNVYFSLEHQYSQNSHGYITQVVNAGLSYVNRLQSENIIMTPTIDIDSTNELASWEEDMNAVAYEVVIDNGDIRTITNNSMKLTKGSHISVRSIYDDGTKSNWSIPKALISYLYEDTDDHYAYVYFSGSGTSSTKVEKGTKINSIELVGDEIRTFDGWYLEPGLINKVSFPYTVNENVTFYPKWNYVSDIYTRDYYYLVNSSNTIVDGFIWNYDNYDFYEYELKNINLNNGTYKVVSLDKQTTYETFTISSSGEYSIYFSEDKVWTNQGASRHVYVKEVVNIINIYFTRNRDSWKTGTLYAYVWNGSTGSTMSSWPGTAMTYSHTNSYGEDIYTIQIDLSKYDCIIFAVNTGSETKQTPDISLIGVGDNQGYYISDKDSSGKYLVGTWTYNG